MIVYADTSALAKLLVSEPGAAEMRNVAASAEAIAAAAIAYVELRAAIAAAVRDRRIRPTRRDRVVAEIERLWGQVLVISIDEPLLRRAGDLAEAVGLRGDDAIHLAALEAAGEPGAIDFACWDRDLRIAASSLGYSLVPA